MGPVLQRLAAHVSNTSYCRIGHEQNSFTIILDKGEPEWHSHFLTLGIRQI